MKNVHILLKAAPHISTPVPDVIDRFARASDDALVGDEVLAEGRVHRVIEVHLTHVVVVPA